MLSAKLGMQALAHYYYYHYEVCTQSTQTDRQTDRQTNREK